MRAAAPTRCVSSGTRFGLGTGKRNAGLLASRGNLPAQSGSECHPRHPGVVKSRALRRPAHSAVRSSSSDFIEPAEELRETADAFQSPMQRSDGARSKGYFRWPALHENLLVFVCEDDLHSVDVNLGGLPRRLTDTPGPARAPVFSPCGTHIAFTVAEDECEEVYVVHRKGGAAIKLTGSGAEFARVACWTPDGESLVFASSASAQFVDAQELWAVQIVYDDAEEAFSEEQEDTTANTSGKRSKKNNRTIVGASEPSRLRLGPANAASFRPGCAGRMLGRDARDPATRHWKGYKGGACGELWLDLNGANVFRRVHFDGFQRGDEKAFFFGGGGDHVDGDEQTSKAFSAPLLNVGDAAWASRDVVVLVADDGSGRANLCSFRVPPPQRESTEDENVGTIAEDAPINVTLVKHTSRRDFCVRHPTLDAAAVKCGDKKVTAVYASGGRLFSSVLDVSDDDEKYTKNKTVAGREIPIEWRGAEAQCERFRLESPDEYVEDVTLHPEGLTVVATARGRAFAMGLWDGPAIELEPPTPTKSAKESFGDASSYAPPGSDVLFDIAVNRGGTRSSAYAPRARLCAYLWDATRVAVVRDAAGEDDIEIHWEDGSRDAISLNVPPAVLGRPVTMTASPESSLLAVVNHRAELLVVDCDTGSGKTPKSADSSSARGNIPVVRLADTSAESGGIRHVQWSPCGCWLAYTWHESAEVSLVRVLDVRTGVARDITAPILSDSSPAWDPAGDYLYFLSSRELEPAYDANRFGLSFHGSEKPHCVALRKDVRNPLLRALRPPHDGSSSSSDEYDSDDDSDDDDASSSGKSDDDSDSDAPPPIDIDFDGVFDRVVSLPLTAGRYSNLIGLDDGRFCVVRFPNRQPGKIGLDAPYYAGESDDGSEDDEDGVSNAGGALLKFDMQTLKSSVLIEEGVKDVVLSMDRRSVLLRVKNESGYADEYRCYKAGAKPDDEDSDGEEVDFESHDRRSGLLDLESRLDQIVVTPRAEWTQMLCEAWRVLRDEWWTESMAPGDSLLLHDASEVSNHSNHSSRWTECLRRYAFDVLPRAAARSEVNDVFAELSAELRSSHVAVAVGDAIGETRRRLNATPGRLGCDAVWDPGYAADGDSSSSSGYRITKLVKGDAWDSLAGGALVKPGVNVEVGDVLLKINGRRLTKTRGVSEALVGLGGKEVSLTFRVSADKTKRPSDDAGLVASSMRDLRVSNDGKKKKKDEDAKTKKAAKKALHKRSPMTHPKFTPNPSAAKPDLRRVPNSVVTVRVRAMHSELDARYKDLVQFRYDRVREITNDRVGYLHVPDMERFGYGEFWRRFPKESKKEALVVDLRGNCGGHISELILAKLAQRPLAFDVPRRGQPTAYPSHASGFVVTLVDQDTGSDAELAAHAFRRNNLGPIVGTRTWGGLLTVAGGGARLVDGGYVSFPSQNVVAFEEEEGGGKGRGRPGNGIENFGVVPDVSVTISPSAHLKGEDPQLDAAAFEALKLLQSVPFSEGDKSYDVTQATKRETDRVSVSLETKRRDAALAAATRTDGSNSNGKRSGEKKKNASWPFKTFAPYPEASDSESRESEASDESESDEDVRRRDARGKAKGASRRR